jgi:hypothetical protein
MDASTPEEQAARNDERGASVPGDIELLAEQCCDEFHGELGTYQDFADRRGRWREFAKFLWGLGARPMKTRRLITIRVHDVRVFHGTEEQGPHCRAIGYMPGGQILIEGCICAGHSPSVQAAAMKDVSDWLHSHRPGWDIKTLPGEGIISHGR